MKKISWLLVLALMLAMPAWADKSSKSKTPQKPRAVTVYTVAGCDACASLMQYLKNCGIKLNSHCVSECKYDESPTVEYSDGKRDNGERIFARTCALPATLKVEKSGEE